MKLAVKLVRIIVLGIVVVLVADGFLSFQRQRDLSEADMRHAIRVLDSTVRQLVVERWRTVGRERAWKVIADANKADPSIGFRWVWLDAPRGDPDVPRVSSDELEPVFLGQDVSVTERDGKGQAYLYFYFAVAVDDQRPGAVEVREPLSRLNQFARRAFSQDRWPGGLIGAPQRMCGFAAGDPTDWTAPGPGRPENAVCRRWRLLRSPASLGA